MRTGYLPISRAAFVALLAALLIGGGCGGGHDNADRVSNRSGAVTVTIRWPVTRAIPEATRSIKLSAQVMEPENGPVVKELVVPRPGGQTTSTATLEPVPSVKVRLLATAHASADGTGSVLARGSIDIQVPEDGAIPADIVMGSITRVEIQLGAPQVRVGDSVGLSARAFDEQGNPVEVAPTSWQWSIVPETVATIVPGGAAAQVFGVAGGSAVAFVTLAEAGLSASVNVTVVGDTLTGTYTGLGFRLQTPQQGGAPPEEFRHKTVVRVVQTGDQVEIEVSTPDFPANGGPGAGSGFQGVRRMTGTLVPGSGGPELGRVLLPDGTFAIFSVHNRNSSFERKSVFGVVRVDDTQAGFWRFDCLTEPTQ